MRIAIVLFLLISIAYANLTFGEIQKMPTSYAKDYYTWRFILDKNSSKEEALQAYQWTKKKSYKLKKAIRKKLGHLPEDDNKKSKKNPKNFIIYPSTASKKSLKALKKLYKKIQKQGKYSDTLKVMASDDPFKTLSEQNASLQCYIFNGVTSTYRKNHFNKAFSPQQLELLIHEKQFNKSIHKIVTNYALQNSKKSLMFFIDDNKLTFESNFLLAMNAVEFKQTKVAINFLNIARKKTTRQKQFDQIDFWLYLLTKDKKYLEQLLKSYDINIYTLRTRDILNKPYPKVVTPKLPFRYFEDFDVTNPIDWEKLKIEMKKHPKELNELAKKYESSITLGIYSYIKEKESHYKVHYYPMPYPLAMWGFSKKRTALLYAIAKQESRFIPASVSSSYALGMMQIMPFLIKHLAKERGQEIDFNEIFNPYVAVNYANQHLDYLNKWLYHPLFVAYAYNGGIGFTRRTLRKENLFRKGEYEPYLSMELIDYRESREYAKKVLANYVVYLNLLGIQTNLSSLLSSLEYPDQTDRFRK